MYHYALFDLDGTLTDSSEGIINSIIYALDKRGYVIPERSELLPFIGPPLAETFEEYLNLPEGKGQEMAEVYHEYFSVRGLYENRVYDGVSAMLSSLKEAGVKVCLATSKPEKFAGRILEHFSLDGYFDHIVGATLDGKLSKKADIVGRVVDDMGITENSGAVMVGDREYDINGANASHLDSIGVLYGFGGREELENAGATWLAKDPGEVLGYILGYDAN